MAYRRIKKYRTRKDYIRIFYQKFKVAIWFFFVFLLLWLWQNRVSVRDYLKTFFY